MKHSVKKKVVIANLEPFEDMFDDLVNILSNKLPEARGFEGCISINACIDEKKKLSYYMRFGLRKVCIKTMLSGEKKLEFTT